MWPWETNITQFIPKITKKEHLKLLLLIKISFHTVCFMNLALSQSWCYLVNIGCPKNQLGIFFKKEKFEFFFFFLYMNL